MTAQHPLLLPGLMSAVIILVGISALLLLRDSAHKDLEARVALIVANDCPSDTSLPERFRALTAFLRVIGESILTRTHFYSRDDLAALEGMLSAAGYHPKSLLPVVMGAKVVSLFLVPLVAVGYGFIAGVHPTTRVIIIAASLPAGLLGPEWILSALRRPYIKALQRGIADALDLLVVCTEAGMGLESALEQVTREIGPSNRAMAAALSRLLDDLKVMPDRKEALLNFGRRSGVEAIRRTMTILAQTLQYGTPLGHALRAVATELRRERAVRLEEKAVRLPALLVFPLVFFILPSLFIVMGASSVLRLTAVLGSFGGHHTGG
jgi:tight adherence protein C